MKLWEYEGKNIRLTTDDGKTFEGKAHEYTSPLDNEPEIATICIGHTEFLETEIKKIELI